MRRSRPWLRTAGLVTTLALVLWPVQALAHLDPPRPPVLVAEAKLLRVTFLTDEDDGPDFNAEFLLTVNVSQPNHPPGRTQQYEKYDFNFDDGSAWAFDAVVYDHEECTERDPMTGTVNIFEVDTTLTDQVATSFASALAGIGASLAYGALMGTAVGPGGMVAGAVGGLAVSLLGLVNGNDDMGTGAAVIPAAGSVEFDTAAATPAGAPGLPARSAVIVRGRTSIMPEQPGCGTPAEPRTFTAGERTGAIYPHLQQVMALAAQIDMEPGNPAGLTAAQLVEIRRTWTRAAVGLAELAAGAEIEEAVALQGAEAAAELFLTARELSAADPGTAVEMYSQAFHKAAVAREQNVNAATSFRLPLQVSLSGDFFATRPHRTVEVAAAAFGAGGPAELVVEGLPATVKVTVDQENEEIAVYKITMALGDLAPGTYPFKVTAAAESGKATAAGTIMVSPDPGPYQGGVLVPAVTAGGVTVATIDPARDQAMMDAAPSFRLKLPGGTVGAPAGAKAEVKVSELTGGALKQVLAGVTLPAGMKPVGTALDIGVQVSGAPVTAFTQPASLVFDLGAAGLPTAIDPAKVGFFRLSEDGVLTFTGGRQAGALMRGSIPRPGRYLVAEFTPPFSDMADHWATADVDLMASKQVARGLPDGRFDPGGGVTRAQFAAMLGRAMQLRPKASSATFQDVRPTDWFFGDVNLAVAHGLAQGNGDGTFTPNAPINREQAAIMLARALRISGKALPLSPAEVQEQLAPYADRDSVNSWAKADLALVTQAGLLRGKTPDMLAPHDGASRAEAAVMTARFWRE